MTAQRRAQVTWDGDLLNGQGRVRFGSGAVPEVPVSWASRTGTSNGKTSPEELLAGAHASCYSMALSAELARNRTPSKTLKVEATATFDKVGEGWKVTTMELAVEGNVPGIDAAKFEELAEVAKNNCPISQALKNNVQVTLRAALV